MLSQLSSDSLFLRQISCLQYTVVSPNIALQVTKFVKTNLAGQLADQIMETEFEFEFDL